MFNNYIRGGFYTGIGWFPNNPTREDYEKDVYYSYDKYILEVCFGLYLIHLLLLLVYCIDLYQSSYEKEKKKIKKNQIIFTIGYLIINCISCVLYVSFKEENMNICKYPFQCEEGKNDTISASYYYYAVMDVNDYCPTMNLMIKHYLKEKNIFNENCDLSEYGCCEYRPICFAYSEYQYPYSIISYDIKNDIFEKETYSQEKMNNEGNNCITYKDENLLNSYDTIRKIIESYLEISSNTVVIKLLIYGILYLVIYFVILSKLYFKTEYNLLNKENEKIKLTGIV